MFNAQINKTLENIYIYIYDMCKKFIGKTKGSKARYKSTL